MYILRLFINIFSTFQGLFENRLNMNYKIGIIALVALQAYAVTALRPCVCARNYRPVCGSDGKTYSTECTLNCQKYKDKSNLTVASIGRCNEEPCICTMEYNPVCGNDGKIYPNRCAMECTRSTNPTIAVAHQGPCDVPCVCPDILQEVCGSDGNTYDNDCVLNCQTAKDHTLSIKHAGKCETVKVADIKLPPCTCARDLKPVCGSDGKTYTNDCLLNCATANDATLSISHPGECGKVNVVENAPSGCVCSRDLKPVCGSNGVTYNNECLLTCAGQTMAGYGEC